MPANPPDVILCQDCGEEIEPEFIAESESGGCWVHSANGLSACGRPARDWGYRL